MAASQPWRVLKAAGIAGSGEVAIGDPIRTRPVTFPERVLQLQRELDWNSFLPAQAATRRWRMAQAVKRGLDIVLSLVLLILLSPILLLIGLLTKLTSPGPILYEFRVLGKHARPVVAYKFRTMVTNADDLKPMLMRENEMQGPAFKMRADPRVTRLGRWLRKYSLDELPQLWSVLIGDMSLVGPRPPLAEEFAAFEPWQWGKLAVTPGITCIWQVTGRSDISDFDEWVSLDLQYIRNWSLWLDCKLMLKTIPAVIRARGAY